MGEAVAAQGLADDQCGARQLLQIIRGEGPEALAREGKSTE